mmetsp:Transcript_115837/g.258932  ORF Transcript_115837/g.258932 Transcript_115837/m.258932 type:complete len:117 (-) Transcript_115837:463-813(-)
MRPSAAQPIVSVPKQMWKCQCSPDFANPAQRRHCGFGAAEARQKCQRTLPARSKSSASDKSSVHKGLQLRRRRSKAYEPPAPSERSPERQPRSHPQQQCYEHATAAATLGFAPDSG